jgi:hypothetical protein
MGLTFRAYDGAFRGFGFEVQGLRILGFRFRV